jgi:hypothetical protein
MKFSKNTIFFLKIKKIIHEIFKKSKIFTILFVCQAFGPFLAFVYVWISLTIFLPVQNAIVALTFATYALSPLMMLGGGDCGVGASPPDAAVRLLAAVLIGKL